MKIRTTLAAITLSLAAGAGVLLSTGTATADSGVTWVDPATGAQVSTVLEGSNVELVIPAGDLPPDEVPDPFFQLAWNPDQLTFESVAGQDAGGEYSGYAQGQTQVYETFTDYGTNPVIVTFNASGDYMSTPGPSATVPMSILTSFMDGLYDVEGVPVTAPALAISVTSCS